MCRPPFLCAPIFFGFVMAGEDKEVLFNLPSVPEFRTMGLEAREGET